MANNRVNEVPLFHVQVVCICELDLLAHAMDWMCAIDIMHLV